MQQGDPTIPSMMINHIDLLSLYIYIVLMTFFCAENGYFNI